MSFTAGQILTADDLNTATRKCIARGRRTSDKTAITSEVGVLRLDDVPILGGRLYRVQLDSMRMSTVAATVTARFRYTTDGSTPTTASTGLAAFIYANSTAAESFAMSRIYAPSVDETLSVLFTLQSTASIATANASADSPIDLLILDEGEDPGDTGVDI